ncbi:unnamed protein product, partial [marine sediment metagenome]
MKVIKTAKYKKAQMEELSAQDIFNKQMKLYKDERKAAEATLDLLSGGMFSVTEEPKISRGTEMKKTAGRKRIKDRGIDWKEYYHERSAKLKKRFEKDIGPGVYKRWEGHDYGTDGDYFIVVG